MSGCHPERSEEPALSLSKGSVPLRHSSGNGFFAALSMTSGRLAMRWLQQRLLLWDETVTEFLGTAGELFEDSNLVVALVVVLARFDKRRALRQQGVDDAGQFVSRRGNGLGHPVLRGFAAQEGAQGTVRVVQRLRRDPECRGGTIGTGQGASAQHLAPAHPRIGGQPQPGAEVLGRRPAAQV